MNEVPTKIRSDLLAIFFEDAGENLSLLENGLLRFETEGCDAELVNEIFRAAHSLKGAAGSFGFPEVTTIAHAMETRLDEIREGRKEPGPSLVATLLRGVDDLRNVLEQVRVGERPDPALIAAARTRLEEVSSGSGDEAESAMGARPAEAAKWSISFRPHENLMHTGNDPVLIIEELARLGEVKTQVDTDRLPALGELDPENLFLAWRIELKGAVTREQLDDVFGWVEDECELDITRVESPGAGAVTNRRSDPRESPRSSGAAVKATHSIRVGLDKIDLLMNMVGELVITQSMLGEINTQEDVDRTRLEQLSEGLTRLSRNTRDLQESVMRIRSMPISTIFNRFPRLVHDLSHQFGKKVDLRTTGGSTELDKTVLEKLSDPLVHLIRNSLDHGFESPERRLAQGKAETATLQLIAQRRGSSVIVEVKDDGRGLDRQKILARARERGIVREKDTLTDEEIDNLIFRPGFSTADTVSNVSGRGVGMDVVRRNIQALGGKIDVQSNPGKGTTVTVRIPLTLAIVEGQLIRLGAHIYILPLTSIIESLQVDPEFLASITGRQTYRLRDEIIPIIDLSTILGVRLDSRLVSGSLLVVVEGDGRNVGFLVDELLAQQQVVIKNLDANYRRVEGLTGATILGDGSVSFILDPAGLIALAGRDGSLGSVPPPDIVAEPAPATA